MLYQGALNHHLLLLCLPWVWRRYPGPHPGQREEKVVAHSDAEPASAPWAVRHEEAPPIERASRVRLVTLSKVPMADFPTNKPRDRPQSQGLRYGSYNRSGGTGFGAATAAQRLREAGVTMRSRNYMKVRRPQESLRRGVYKHNGRKWRGIMLMMLGWFM